MQHGLAPTSAQDGPAEKDGGTQGGRLAIAALWGSLALINLETAVGELANRGK